MSCTFYGCEQSATREIVWMSVGLVQLDPVKHDYCEAHAQGIHDNPSQLVIRERVLEVAR